VVAFDCRCQKRWAKRLPSAPTVLKCFTPQGAETPRIIVGCEDGSVAVLDGTGQPIRSDKVTGRPTCIEAIGAVVLLATDKGEVKALKVE